MTAFTRGELHSSFWIVDRKHIYIGSADMDWRSLSKVTTKIDNRSMQSETEQKINEPRQSGLQFTSGLKMATVAFGLSEIKAGQTKT